MEHEGRGLHARCQQGIPRGSSHFVRIAKGANQPLWRCCTHFFLLRSGTTVTREGITASEEMGLLGEESFLGFLVSLLVRWSPFAMGSSCWLVEMHADAACVLAVSHGNEQIQHQR
jgi:hypothetical protein